MAGFVHVPWYATGFRGDKLQAALIEITSIAPRYGATGYSVYRSRDDRYKFLQMLEWNDKLDWERYWDGPEISGSHFANAWEATLANELIEESKIRPVLWQTMGFEKVAEAHQLLRDNKHLGKIAILVGATDEGQGKTAEGPGAIRAEVGA